MARTTVTDTVLLLDDELYNLAWMVEYLEGKHLTVKSFANANDVVPEIRADIYRLFVVDLNVPIFPPLDLEAQKRGEIYRRYPGLYIALLARNRGYRDRQVLLYSVHRDQAVETEAEILGCTYIRKGRPREMKSELDDVLSYDPTSQR